MATEEEQLREILRALERIEGKISKLPCQRDFCPVKKETDQK